MSETLRPPSAPPQAHSFTHLGRSFEDPFAWLERKGDADVLAWLEAENAYTRQAMEKLRPLRQQLFAEMLGRVQEDDSSAPVRHGGFEYFSRTRQGDAYRRLYRRALPTALEPHPADELLLDENELAQGLEYCRILRAIPSPDHTRLAWLVDTSGAWVFELWVKDLESGALLAGPIPECGYSAAWSADGNHLFFTRFDHAHRAAEVLRLELPAHGREPELVYAEEDEAFHLGLSATRSGALLTVEARSTTTSEVHYLRADRPLDALTRVLARRHGHEYTVEHLPDPAGTGEGQLLICSNDAGPNFRLVRSPLDAHDSTAWVEVVPHREEVLLEAVHPFRSFIALEERQAALQRVRLLQPDGTPAGEVHFPEAVYTVSLGETQHYSGFDQNPDFDCPTLRLFYSSMVTPYSTVDFDMASGKWHVARELPVPGYDRTRYETQRLWATSHDGAQVPVSIARRRDQPMDGNRPVLLYGYGAYGYSADPDFDANWVSLLDRGFVLAIAHIRGGSELGRAWYDGGRLLQKANSFHDFIAAAEALIAQGYTRPGRIGATGGSAGGLLMGVVTNWRPELWGAVVARVPFTNVISAMIKPELPLTVIEWEQWGNPAIPEQFEAMLAYSPYDNIRAQHYPPLFVTAGYNDLQVPYWDPAKYVARLRNTETGDAPILLKINMGAGHSSASGRYAKLEDQAELFAFVIHHLGADAHAAPAAPSHSSPDERTASA